MKNKKKKIAQIICTYPPYKGGIGNSAFNFGVQMKKAGFEVESVLSGSNLRSPKLKKVLGKKPLLAAESVLQPMLAPLYFGPSIWLKLRKK